MSPFVCENGKFGDIKVHRENVFLVQSGFIMSKKEERREEVVLIR